MLDQQFGMSSITGITDNGAKSCHSLPDTCRMLHILYLWGPIVLYVLGTMVLFLLDVEKANAKLLEAKN